MVRQTTIRAKMRLGKNEQIIGLSVEEHETLRAVLYIVIDDVEHFLRFSLPIINLSLSSPVILI